MGAAGQDALAWARAKRLALWLDEILGRGKPLDDSVRRQMEGFFGHNLEDVRIHDSHQAGEVARRLGAEAFAVGSRIFAARERLNPETAEGMGLLAHELTHVIQQTQPQPVPHSVLVREGIPQQSGQYRAGGETAQFAGYSPSSLISAEEDMEAEAQASEEVMRAVESAGQSAAISPEIDVDELADRVYRFMQQDLILGREQRVGN